MRPEPNVQLMNIWGGHNRRMKNLSMAALLWLLPACTLGFYLDHYVSEETLLVQKLVREAGVTDERVMKLIEEEAMDVEAMLLCEEEDLKELGITKKGHQLKVKNYFKKHYFNEQPTTLDMMQPKMLETRVRSLLDSYMGRPLRFFRTTIIDVFDSIEGYKKAFEDFFVIEDKLKRQERLSLEHYGEDICSSLAAQRTWFAEQDGYKEWLRIHDSVRSSPLIPNPNCENKQKRDKISKKLLLVLHQDYFAHMHPWCKPNYRNKVLIRRQIPEDFLEERNYVNTKCRKQLKQLEGTREQVRSMRHPGFELS